MQVVAIQQRIFEVRGFKVMLDYDLATLYEVPTKVLNQAVKRNTERFPKDFMFQLKDKEWNQIQERLGKTTKRRSQFVTSSQKYRNVLPYVFTEHGVTMLASVLKSNKAIKMNIAIVRAFNMLREWANNYKELAEQIKEIKRTVGDHHEQLEHIYTAIENLVSEKTNQKSWEDRERIGFRRS